MLYLDIIQTPSGTLQSNIHVLFAVCISSEMPEQPHTASHVARVFMH